MKAQIIAIANQKGGIGKSTSVYNIGAGLAMNGKKVLLLDVNHQGDLSKMLGLRKPHELPLSLGTAMNDVITMFIYRNRMSGIYRKLCRTTADISRVCPSIWRLLAGNIKITPLRSGDGQGVKRMHGGSRITEKNITSMRRAIAYEGDSTQCKKHHAGWPGMACLENDHHFK